MRKNVSILTRNRAPNTGEIINGVKYVTGDVKISDMSGNWQTLIVKGDVTFDEDFNTDNYDTSA
jgi:hypothetical protein